MRKSIALLVLISIMIGMFTFVPPVSAAEVYEPNMLCNFDSISPDINLDDDTESYNYTATGGSVYMQGKTGAPLITGDVPEPDKKAAGTDLSEGTTDKAVALNVGTASKNPYFNVNIPDGMNTYKKFKVAFNTYISAAPSSPSAALFQVEMRNKTGGDGSLGLISYRTGYNIQSLNTNIATYKVKTWYRVEIIVDGKNKTFDMYINGTQYKDDAAISSALTFDPSDTANSSHLFKQLRFTVSAKSSITAGLARAYIDDIYLGELKEGPEPVFARTTHASGVDSTEATDVKHDLQSIVAKFPFNMDESTFDGKISLTKGDSNTPVAYTGTYNAATREYSAAINEPIDYNTEYHLTFKAGIMTGSNQEDPANVGITFDHDIVITIKTEIEVLPAEFGVTKLYFSNGTNSITKVNVTDSMVYGNADIIYSQALTSPVDITAIVALYDGKLKHVWNVSKNIQPPQTNGDIADTVTVPISLSGIELNENCQFKLFVWENSNTIRPLYDQVATAGVSMVDLSDYDILYMNDFENPDVDITRLAMCSGTTYDDRLKLSIAAAPNSDTLGNALKISYPSGNKTGEYPYFDMYFQNTENPFIVDLKMYTPDFNTARHIGYRATNAGATRNLLNYRPLKELNIQGYNNVTITNQPFSLAKWDRYRLVIDPKTGKYDAYKNATKIISQMSIVANDKTTSIRFGFDTYMGPAVTYIDDVRVYGGSEFIPDSLLNDTSLADRTWGGRVQYNCYPEGKNKAVTFSFDDCRAEDRTLVQHMNQYGMKGTFNIVTNKVNASSSFITSAEIPTLYAGDEVASHGDTHATPETMTPEQYEADLITSKTKLQGWAGYPIRGYAYPNGKVGTPATPDLLDSEEALNILIKNNMAYARLIAGSPNYELPTNFMIWNPQVKILQDTTDTDKSVMTRVDEFNALTNSDTMKILYIWGHSFEMEGFTLQGYTETGWALFDKVLEKLSGKSDVWYATNIQIVDYVNAVRKLVVTDTSIKNNSSFDVWVTLDGAVTKIPAGQSLSK